MKKITIFLASSNELKSDREQFEIEIYRKCKAWFDKGIFLHLDIWEDTSAKMSPTRSQDVYNKLIEEKTDVFVLLADTKVGLFTAEEFEKAYGAFKAENKPFIFTYFKEPTAPVEPSLTAFKQKVRDLGHFKSNYKDSNDLWVQFNKELDRLERDGFTKNEFSKSSSASVITVDNRDATIHNQFNGGTFNNPVFQ